MTRSCLLCLSLALIASGSLLGQSGARTGQQAKVKRDKQSQKPHSPRAEGRLELTVREASKSGVPIPLASIVLQPLALAQVSDGRGEVRLSGIPDGSYTLEVSSMGYVTERRTVSISAGLPVSLNVELKPSTLALGEVTVTARPNLSSPSTSSTIGRQAMDHLQAMSLADVMQLIPGQLMQSTDLTSRSNLQLRSLVNNSTSAFGSSIVVDGVPISQNAQLTQGNFSSTAFVGTDLRNISTDDLESVEVVRGIPSAEYGDLTSGLVIAKSKVGLSPLSLRAKIGPAVRNYSASKGLAVGKSRGDVVNFSLDYAQAWGDPRRKTRSFDRYIASVGYAFRPSNQWYTTTRLRYGLGRDWTGTDPDVVADGSFNKSMNHSLGLTHSGQISLGEGRRRHSLNYTLGLTYGMQKTDISTFVAVPQGSLAIINALETGYHDTQIQTSSYRATGITESRPLSLFVKASDRFRLRTARLRHQLSYGVEYRLDHNNARGYYNADDRYPLRPNSNGRPRPFRDIPPLHQLSLFAEDQMRLPLGKGHALRLHLGARLSAQQPWADNATLALSPRINAGYELGRYLELRAGIGWSSKAPGLAYLYPDRRYSDRIAVNYRPTSNPLGHKVVYHTYVYDDVRNPNLSNATSRKIEFGLDVKLPNRGRLSLIAYHDQTPSGFEILPEYTVYDANYYSQTQGLIMSPAGETTVDWTNPERTDKVFLSSGKLGNTAEAVNRGVEMDFDFGEIKSLRTTVYLSGAYSETETRSMARQASDPRGLPVAYTQTGTIPFKVFYPGGLAYSTYRQVVNTLRLVTRIPELRMVASLSGQVVWYQWRKDTTPGRNPIAYLDTNLQEHPITEAMLQDPSYTISGVRLSDQVIDTRENVPVKQPITWMLSARLTKELGNVAILSLYANNMLYHEPFLSSSASSTLTQRNAGSFSFGAELSIKL